MPTNKAIFEREREALRSRLPLEDGSPEIEQEEKCFNEFYESNEIFEFFQRVIEIILRLFIVLHSIIQ